MAQLHFYLDKRKGQKDNLPIFLFFSYDGSRYKNYTGERVDSKHWNMENEKVKRSHPEYEKINDYLERLADRVKAIYRDAKSNGIQPSNDYFRSKLETQPSNQYKVLEVLPQFIGIRSSVLAKNTINTYKNVLSNLKLYEQKTGKKIYFDVLHPNFFDRWTEFLMGECDLLNDTIAIYLTRFKTFLAWATLNGYNKNLSYRDYQFIGKRLKDDEKEVIFLTHDELMRLYHLKLGNQRLEKVRDFFCFGCFTGLRYSDIRNLKKVNIKGDWLKLNTIKKGGYHTIPLNDYAKAILTKYNHLTDGNCLPAKGNKEMNKDLRIIAKIAKIDEQVHVVKFKKAKRIETVKPKYELLTTHAGRKTFITLALEKNVHTKVLMDITGHATEKAFKRYYKIFDNNKMEAMQHIFGSAQ